MTTKEQPNWFKTCLTVQEKVEAHPDVTIVCEATFGRSIACVPHGFPERVLFYKEAPIFLV
jgi:hypothetical protein